MRLPGQLPLEQVQVQIVAQARLRVLVQAAVLAQGLVQEPELELAQVQLQELELALGLQLEREPAQQPELAAVLEQARKLRVSRQLVQQQHRLPTAAHELPPYRPVLPMKALC